MAQMMFFSGVIKQENRKYLVNPFEKLVGEPIMLQKDEFVRLTPEAYIKVVDLLDLKHREPICVIYVDSDVDCEKLSTQQRWFNFDSAEFRIFVKT